MRRWTLLPASVAIAYSALALTSWGKAPKPTPCPGGRFLVSGSPLVVGDTAPAPEAVTLAGSQVSVGTSCPATAAKIKATKLKTKVQVGFATCTGITGKVKLKAVIDKATCSSMTGTFVAKKSKVKESFTAKLSRCGDDVVDPGAGEQCDSGDAGCPAGDHCSNTCQCSPENTTTTLLSTSTTVVPTTSTVVLATTTTVTETSTTSLPHHTTTTRATVCGDGFVEEGETCDDGNTVDETTVPYDPNNIDHCPADCRIEGCTPVTSSSRKVTVELTGGVPDIGLAGVTVFLRYPEGKVVIPGSGAGVGGSILGVPAGFLSQPNDLDYGLLEALVGSGDALPQSILTVNFQDCQGVDPPAASDFICVVKDAADTNFSTVAGVQCGVSLQ
jgi:hypothetical protein